MGPLEGGATAPLLQNLGRDAMGWECRGRCRYYTRSKRAGDRIVREYVGTGPAAERAALEDARRRTLRAQEALDRQAVAVRWDALEAKLKSFEQGLHLLTKAVLLAEGYHQHHRGEWRKRHGSPIASVNTELFANR